MLTLDSSYIGLREDNRTDLSYGVWKPKRRKKTVKRGNHWYYRNYLSRIKRGRKILLAAHEISSELNRLYTHRSEL
jgi:hypothetical protein